jgi:hypothetical protein
MRNAGYPSTTLKACRAGNNQIMTNNQIQNFEPETRNPKPETRNPEPETSTRRLVTGNL